MLNYGIQVNELKKSLDMFNEKSMRLKIVKMKKKEMPHLLSLGEKQEFDCELMSTSEFSTDSSQISGESGSSTKSKKRKKRKKTKKRVVKEGSPLEEQYLVDLLNSLKPTLQNKGSFLQNKSLPNIEEIESLLEILEYFALFDEIEKIKQLFNDLVKLTENKTRTLEQEEIYLKYKPLFDIFPEFAPQTDAEKKPQYI